MPATTPALPLRWVREPQAREYLGNVSVRTWKRWEAEGIIKGFLVGRTKMYDLTALDRVVLRGRIASGGPAGRARKAVA